MITKKQKSFLEKLRSKVVNEGYFPSVREICEITGRKEGTVKSQLHRGLAKLQDILVRWGVLLE